MKVLTRITLVVLLGLLFPPVLSVTGKPENMDSESETFYQKILDIVKETVAETIRVKVGALAARQAEFEETSFKTLASLHDQISQLGQTIPNSAIVENLSPLVLSSPPPKAMSCNDCGKTFSTQSELDHHVKCHHLSSICNHCGKTLRSQPDLNLHYHKYHTRTEQVQAVHEDQLPHQPNHSEPPSFHHCTKCGFKSTNLVDLREHQSTCHVPPFTGNLSPENQPTTVVSNEGSETVKCIPCGKSFLSQSELNNHVASSHETQRAPSIASQNHLSQNTVDDLNYCEEVLIDDSHLSCPEDISPYACFRCGQVLTNQGALAVHLRSVHCETDWYPCYVCNHFFKTTQELAIHIESVHSAARTIHCKFCETTFSNMQTLNEHTAYVHGLSGVQKSPSRSPSAVPSPSLPCSPGLMIDQSSTEFLTDRIAQIDGNDSVISDEDTMSITKDVDINEHDPGLINAVFNFENSSIPDTATRPPTISDKTATFALNKSKQIQNLGAGANIPDCEIEINDKDKNVNIQCSTGFYEAVTKPVVSGLSKGTVFNIDNIGVICTHIDSNRDSKCYEYSRVFHIQLNGGDNGKLKIGKVTIHLHHTKRLLQMQGSAKMPTGHTAPVWFLNSFIKERLSKTAKLRHYDIEAINNAVKNALEKYHIDEEPTKTCTKCARQFTSKAKPTKCASCSKYFHKTCIPPHSSACTSSSVPSALAFSSQSTSPSTYSAQALPTFGLPAAILPAGNPSKRQRTSSNSCVISSIPTTDTTISNGVLALSTSSFVTSSITVCSTISTPSVIPLTSYVSLTNTSSSSSSNVSTTSTWASEGSFPSAIQNPTTRKRAKANATQITPEAAKINFLNLELNATKTKIAQLETTISDRDITIKIQQERIKVLAKNQVEFVNQRHSINVPPTNPINTQHSTYHHPGGCTPCYQAATPYLPCHGHAQLHHQQPAHHVHPGDTGRSSREHLELLQDIKASLICIQDGMDKIASDRVVTNSVSTSESVGATKEHETVDLITMDIDDKDQDHIEVVSVEVISTDNDNSVASADDNVPDTQLPPQQDLNFLA